jgi:hypothetical protein
MLRGVILVGIVSAVKLRCSFNVPRFLSFSNLVPAHYFLECKGAAAILTVNVNYALSFCCRLFEQQIDARAFIETKRGLEEIEI